MCNVVQSKVFDKGHPYHICKNNFKLIEKVLSATLVLRSSLQNPNKTD